MIVKFKRENDVLEVDLPLSWQSLPFKVGAALYKILQETTSDIEILACLLQTTVQEIRAFDNGVARKLIEQCAWVNTPFDFETCYCPTSFLFRGEGYSLPYTFLSGVGFGQFEDAKSYFRSLPEDATKLQMIEIYPKIVSTFLQPILQNCSYDYEKAESLFPEVEMCSFADVVAYGNFFLKIGLISKENTKKDAPRSTSRLSKFRQVTWKFLKRLGLA